MPPSDPSQAPETAPASEGASPPVDADDEDRALVAQLTVGAVVDSKYRVDRVMGRGAMGVVVQATHVHLGEKVALKFLRYRAKAGTGEDFQSRFRREARVSAKLKNEHITRVIDVGMWKDRVPYMVMDYLEGMDLREVVKSQGTQALPIGTAIDYTVQVCVGIAEAHANGIVHRDLKPSNLFLTKRPDGSEIVKILDFGISKWRAGEGEVGDLTETGVVLGSPKYMAPEQLFGSSDVDSRADVWSIGAILYEMLCGRPPFDLPTFTRICAELSTQRPPPSLVERRPEITPELEAVVMKCFVRDPDQRTQNVAELAGSLLDAVQAPFAEPMRQKIASMLDPGNAGLTSASGANARMTTGTYSSMSSGAYASLGTTGTGSGPRNSGGLTNTGSGPTSTRGTEVSSPPAEKPRRWPALALVALLAVGGVVYFMTTGKEVPATPAPPSAAAAVPPPPTVSAAPPPTAPTTTASAVTTATAAATDSSAATATQTRPTHGGGGWHPLPVHPSPTPPTPVAAATTAAPTPAPTPAPAPTPTTKSDPLGDRQ